MDRLTCRGYKGRPSPANYSNLFVLDLPHKTVVEYQKLVARLSEYEDTGLTPEEVAALKAEKERRDKLIEENEALLWDKRCAPCPNCGGTHIRTCHKWLRRHKRVISSYYYGYCASCKYKGNAARLPDGARKAWNDGASQYGKREQK